MRRRCRHCSRPRCDHTAQNAGAGADRPRIHTDRRRQLPDGECAVCARREARGARKRAVHRRDRGNPRKNAEGSGDRDLCTRRNVHERFGTLPALGVSDRQRCEPRRVCAVLPLEIRAHGGKASGAVFSRGRGQRRQLHLKRKGSLPASLSERAGGGRRRFGQDRGQSQGGILCRGRDERLPHGAGCAL